MVRGVFRKVKRGIDMKDLKKTTILCLATFLAFGLCSCSSDTEVTTAPSTTAEETTETTTNDTEATTEETTATDRQTVHVDLGSVMGFDDCYAEGEVSEHYTIWTIYNGNGENIGYQFPNMDSPNIILEDLDGDGIDEMICPLAYDADGGRDVFIFRNNNGTVEMGTCSLWRGYSAFEVDVIYDDETDQIIFLYQTTGEEVPVTIDDFEFEEYVP